MPPYAKKSTDHLYALERRAERVAETLRTTKQYSLRVSPSKNQAHQVEMSNRQLAWPTVNICSTEEVASGGVGVTMVLCSIKN